MKENNWLETILIIAFWGFIGWLFFGGVFSEEDSSNKVYIDCRRSGWQDSPYCNGDFESASQEYDYRENQRRW